MSSDNGGWTLVASIHENDNSGSNGYCSTGDRWSTERGRRDDLPNGDGNWQNRNVFGHVLAAAHDDFKSPAYFELQAKDVMIWQVPNDTPVSSFSASASFKYRTSNGFLTGYGGNLLNLYENYFPIISEMFTLYKDNGPAIPVTFDKGNSSFLFQQFPPRIQSSIEPGYIQVSCMSSIPIWSNIAIRLNCIKTSSSINLRFLPNRYKVAVAVIKRNYPLRQIVADQVKEASYKHRHSN